jgi:hypothetical protein
MKDLNHSSRYAGQVANQIPPNYNRKTLPLQPFIRYKMLKRIILLRRIRRRNRACHALRERFEQNHHTRTQRSE